MASITVEVGLDDFSSDDLIRELGNDYIVIDRSSSTNTLESMYRALTLGNEEAALELLRHFLADTLGRVL